MDRLAINDRYKLYEDGRLLELESDFFEESPIWPQQDTEPQRHARLELQAVLDSYAAYTGFSPTTVPRPDPNAKYADHAFQDQGGYFVVEAEQIPFGRDESWRVESHAPGYLGLGYLRTLQPAQLNSADPIDSRAGVARVQLSVHTVGKYQVAFRLRADYPQNDAPAGGTEKQFPLLFRQFVPGQNTDWTAVTVAGPETDGRWVWVSSDLEMAFTERTNILEIATRTSNLKVDRLVVFRDGYHDKALNLATPASRFHPWSRP